MRCEGCVFASWKRTSSGRLHPDKTGRCTALVEKPLDLRLPASFYWMSYGTPKPTGGSIERGREIALCEFRKEPTT